MKKVLFLMCAFFCIAPMSALAQPTALLDLWKSVDGLQYVEMGAAINKYYLHISTNKPQVTNTQMNVHFSKIPLIYNYAETVRKLQELGYRLEYDIEKQQVTKLRGEIAGETCYVWVSWWSKDIVPELYISFDRELETYEQVIAFFDSIAQELTKIYGKPIECRDVRTKYLPFSALKNDKGFLLGNIHELKNGSVVLTTTRSHTAMNHDYIRACIYFVNNESLKKSLE